MKHFIMIVAAGLMLSSCSFYQVRSQDDVSGFSAPAKKSFMDIEYAPDPQKSYQVIATLKAKTERNRGIDDVIRKMKMEAAVLGADAITDVEMDPEAIKKKDFSKKMRVDYIGKAIIYQ